MGHKVSNSIDPGHRYSWNLTQEQRIRRVEDWLKEGKIGPGDLEVLLAHIDNTPNKAQDDVQFTCAMCAAPAEVMSEVTAVKCHQCGHEMTIDRAVQVVEESDENDT